MSTRTHPPALKPAVPWVAPLAILAAALVVIGVAATGTPWVLEFAFVVALALAVGLAHRALLSWQTLLCGIVLVILFIPIRRYSIPVELPFELEPYRLLVAFVVAGWLASLLVDPKVALRRSGFEAPIALIVAAVLGSVIWNPGRVSGVSADVIKDLTFLASFLLLFFLIVSIVRTRGIVDRLCQTLVIGGAVVGLFALIESRTGWNLFSEFGGRVPFLKEVALPEMETRRGRLRVFASAQHPIALGAALVVLLPLAIYLARRSARRIWWVPAGMIALGAFATVSRTTIVMLIVVGIVFLVLRPRQAKRVLIPALVILPVLVHLALPGTLGTLKKSFFPEGGLIADQQRSAGTEGSGRVSDLGPAFSELARSPLVGQGYGTRITDADRANAQILDNQWLKTLLETGVLGLVGWLWFLIAIIRRLGRAARADQSDEGWLYVALAASLCAFAIGMFTFDAFSFIQATFLMFIVLAIGASALLATEPVADAETVPSPEPTTPDPEPA